MTKLTAQTKLEQSKELISDMIEYIEEFLGSDANTSQSLNSFKLREEKLED